jgi:hypothetical protein
MQTKGRKNQKKETKIVMKINLKKLHIQRNFWKPHRRTFLCWGFYYVNNNVAIDFENAQIMCCKLCHKKSIIKKKSKNTRKKMINFLLQKKWNNFSLKTCGCRSYAYCKDI